MMRPRKEKRIGHLPEQNFFKPANIAAKELSKVTLTYVELEALRLRDKKGLTQQEAAEKMEVSRSTFQRLLTKARRKSAQALLSGQAIKIKGGNYSLQVTCSECGSRFTVSPEKKGRFKHRKGHRRGQQLCPDCRE